jgi:arylsulfatase A-like enzyme
MAVLQGNQKLVKNKKNDPQALYNLDKDREETTNLIERDKDRLKDMQFKWNEWNADLIDCIFPSLSKDEWW